MSEATAVDVVQADQIRRVIPTDFDELGLWLISRLQKIHPEATPQMILTYLRGCSQSNDHWFVRKGGAVALAQYVRVPLESRPICYEVFVFCKEDCEDDAAALYVPMRAWAAGMNCDRIEYCIASDISLQRIREMVGPTLVSRNLVQKLLEKAA
jgi:hypothetical protein